MNILVSDYVRRVQHATGRSKGLAVHSASQAVLDTLVKLPGATRRLVFRHVGTAPAFPTLTSAVHALVAVLQ